VNSIRGLIGPWVWISLVLSAVVAGGIEFGALAGILSPAVWIDVLALWPVAAVGVVAAPIVWLSAGRRPRHLAIAGLSIFTWLALGLALHVSGSAVLPVSAAAVEAPVPSGIGSARFEVDIPDGTLVLSPTADGLYRVSPIRAGGDIGAPAAFEQVEEDEVTVVVAPVSDPGRYVFRGWKASLGADVTWNLDLTAERIDADLVGLPGAVAEFHCDRGEVTLGTVEAPSALEFSGGSHRVYVDPEMSVVFRGQGVVPDDWTLTADGTASSPVAGGGWTISTTGGATVEIWYR
jgi:hypothetical protein